MTLDIGQAYLNAEITDETIIMKIDHEILQLLKIVDPETDYNEFIETLRQIKTARKQGTCDL